MMKVYIMHRKRGTHTKQICRSYSSGSDGGWPMSRISVEEGFFKKGSYGKFVKMKTI